MKMISKQVLLNATLKMRKLNNKKLMMLKYNSKMKKEIVKFWIRKCYQARIKIPMKKTGKIVNTMRKL